MAQQVDFESSLNELEKVVAELDGEIKLERALMLFERGMLLSQELETFLKVAEQKVEVLRRQADGSITKEPFEAADIDTASEE
ncbi:MAG TPA: exodeoxyribonuclease VII small subunit [Candidatus Obscuribacterales bacterium]